MTDALVYVVTAGEYSDYHIEAVFSAPDKAQQYCDELNKVSEYACAKVQPHPIDEEHHEVARKTYRCELPSGECGEETDLTMALPDAREESTTVYDNGDVEAVSFVSIDHAKKLAVEALQAHLRKKALQPPLPPGMTQQQRWLFEWIKAVQAKAAEGIGPCQILLEPIKDCSSGVIGSTSAKPRPEKA